MNSPDHFEPFDKADWLLDSIRNGTFKHTEISYGDLLVEAGVPNLRIAPIIKHPNSAGSVLSEATLYDNGYNGQDNITA